MALVRFRRDTPAPETPLAVIGDVHGRVDLLDRLFDRLDREVPEAHRVCVGDMIDRGPDSRGVLERVRAQTLALRGNHEQMMLDFLDATGDAVETTGARWLRHGGIQTLASFGILEPAPKSATRDALRRALPTGLESWLHALPDRWQSGNVAVVHAGADPRVPLAQQDPQHLLWGHPACGRFPRPDRVWIVHGHTVVPSPRLQRRVITVDTGAWLSGRLSAVLISAQGVRFLTVDG